jgi:hypothetical protein
VQLSAFITIYQIKHYTGTERFAPTKRDDIHRDQSLDIDSRTNADLFISSIVSLSIDALLAENVLKPKPEIATESGK